jgi:hypothetical protein
VDSYFDPGRENLKRVLVGARNASAGQFEHAVVRLMNLLRLPTIWYGKDTEESRNDAAAVLGREGDSPLVFLAEFTTDKPLKKLTMCKDRSRRLQEHLGDDAEVIALLVARGDVAEADIQAAATDGTILIGRADLTQLLKRIGEPTAQEETLRYLLGVLTKLAEKTRSVNGLAKRF